MTDKPKRLEDAEIRLTGSTLDKLAALVCIERMPGEPWPEPDEEAMCEAIKDQIQQELFEWQRTTTKIPYDDGPFKGLLGKALRKAFASAIGVDDNGQCLLTEMEHRASGDKPKRPIDVLHTYNTFPDPRDWRERKAMMSSPDFKEPRWSFPVLPGLTPAEPAVAMATWSEPITWTTGPGKRTARLGDREVRLVKVGDSWFAEGLIDLQWNAKSLGASRDVVELKQAAMAWLKGDAEWDEYQRDHGFIAVYDETQAAEKEQQMTQKALDTLRQSAKK